MTETIVNSEETVRPVAFMSALFAAPLVCALPFFVFLWLGGLFELNAPGLAILAVFPVAAVFFGSPSYLVFGGPAFWSVLRRGGSLSGAALVANLASLPFVFLIYLAVSGYDSAITMLTLHTVLGTLFSLAWGALFKVLYRLFEGGTVHVQPC